jgi:hypothetical protein
LVPLQAASYNPRAIPNSALSSSKPQGKKVQVPMPTHKFFASSYLTSGEAVASAFDSKEDAQMIEKKVYTSRIIKAGALLSDTKMVLAHWDALKSTTENLDAFKRENIFGKASRSRASDVLAIFDRRYLRDEAVTKALVQLVRNRFPDEALNRILYFHSAQSDQLLHDVVTEVLWDFYNRGKTEVHANELQSVLTRWVREGKTAASWQAYTTLRVAQGVLATLRDFGILRGKANKHLAPVHLAIEAFAYIAFYLHQKQPSGERLIKHPEWRLFLLSTDEVERLFLEAHQLRLLEYYAAGPVIRIAFPSESLEEYGRVISERAV